jgi:hypothetical protein
VGAHPDTTRDTTRVSRDAADGIRAATSTSTATITSTTIASDATRLSRSGVVVVVTLAKRGENSDAIAVVALARWTACGRPAEPVVRVHTEEPGRVRHRALPAEVPGPKRSACPHATMLNELTIILAITLSYKIACDIALVARSPGQDLLQRWPCGPSIQ